LKCILSRVSFVWHFAEAFAKLEAEVKAMNEDAEKRQLEAKGKVESVFFAI